MSELNVSVTETSRGTGQAVVPKVVDTFSSLIFGFSEHHRFEACISSLLYCELQILHEAQIPREVILSRVMVLPFPADEAIHPRRRAFQLFLAR